MSRLLFCKLEFVGRGRKLSLECWNYSPPHPECIIRNLVTQEQENPNQKWQLQCFINLSIHYTSAHVVQGHTGLYYRWLFHTRGRTDVSCYLIHFPPIYDKSGNLRNRKPLLHDSLCSRIHGAYYCQFPIKSIRSMIPSPLSQFSTPR